MGSTLSSDLLCLATYSERGSANNSNGAIDNPTNYLFAGGVDGRIHRWTISISHGNKKCSNAGVMAAHNGRVNAMAVCSDMNVLVSVGNDGCVHCTLLMDDSDPSGWGKTSLNLNGDGIVRKITSLCIIHEESNRAIVAIGTSCGQISLVEMNKSEDNVLQVSFLKDGNRIGLDDGEGSVIHALCSKQHDIFCRIMIGHSAGLSVWDLSLQ